ncbi:protein F37C4.5-like isoform X1 [Paramacrobiotus metropolitanus]|uniref:protein F37C4.5-like isoform X1 n=1 Tax=Paramacrobiotus metropolitanus TaxID=2943436 RepID=UPI00244579AE|nr:protein F37C4.5-like isoform X1 [Paramacrobiotus metropolitanus]
MGKKKGCFRIKRNKSTASQRSHNNQPASSTVGVEREPQSEQTIQSVESDPDFMIPPITVTTARNLQLETLPKMRSFFNASDAPISAVTVYLDRAEISRILRFKAEPGEYEVVIQQIRSPVDLASLRVEGHGPAVITDVNLSNNYIEKSQTSDTNQKEKRLRDELQRLNEQKCIEESEEARLKKHLEFWKECMESLASNAFAAKKKTMSPAISDTGNSMIEFLGLQTNETRKLDEKLLQQRRVLNTLNESIETAKKNLNEYTSTSSQNTWNILITLIAEAKGELELNVKYIVHNASWSPKYDVRVASDTKKLSVTYYGLISQRTNEDWSDVQICLSTALPAVGANVPELGTKQLSFASPYTNSIPPPGSSRSMLRGAVNFLHKREASEYFDVGEEIAEHADGVSWARPMHTAVAKVVQGSAITTSFEISKATTVPSDGSQHKVTVGALEMQPQIQYKIVPKKAELAFLEAKAVNTSSYPILPGPASIFFGANFVATTDIKAISPQETFSCSLGVDPAVKVKYRPVRRFNEQSGMLNKTKVVTFVQEIQVTNTRPDPIHVVIMEQVPRSTEEKLKVTLIDPPLTRERPEAKGLVLNNESNIEHTLSIKEHSSYTWTVKHRLEYPSDKNIYETEVKNSSSD